MLEKGIKVDELLKSDLFYHKLDFNDKLWPQVHTNCATIRKGYTPERKNIFSIRDAYKEIFSELAFIEELNNLRKERKAASKVYKINYYLNILP